MKLFLTACAALMWALPAFAQNADLFPELKGLKTPTTQPAKAEQPTKTDTPAQPTATELFPELQQGQEEKPEMDSGNLRLVLTNASSITPTMKNFSYCTASVSLENGAGRMLKNLTVTLMYPPLSSQLSFSNVGPNQAQTQEITLLGEACQTILDVPVMEITSCQLDRTSVEDCKKRVEFVPIS